MAGTLTPAHWLSGMRGLVCLAVCAGLLEMFVSDVRINGTNSLKSFRINKSFKNELKTNWFS